MIFGLLLMFIPLIADQGNNLSLVNTAEIEKNLLELLNHLGFYLSNQPYLNNFPSKIIQKTNENTLKENN